MLATMSFRPPPTSACWQHRTARSGFEVAYFEAVPDGLRVEGTTAAIEDAEAWVVTYVIQLDTAWATRSARVTARTVAGWRETFLESDGSGHWLVDGTAAPHLDGCMDVDLESSAMTNALPVHRMNLRIGEAADAPAAYVRALGLAAERLEQVYRRIADRDARQRYEYTAPAFGFTSRLHYDDSGLVTDYPGIAARAGLPDQHLDRDRGQRRAGHHLDALPIPGGLVGPRSVQRGRGNNCSLHRSLARDAVSGWLCSMSTCRDSPDYPLPLSHNLTLRIQQWGDLP